MARHAFLSPEWIEAAREVHKAHPTVAGPSLVALRMNLVVEDVPFGGRSLDAHVDTTGDVVEVELGHVEPADVKVSLDYPTARAILVDRDGEAAMQAFMAGRIRVEGDMAKLLAFQSAPLADGALAAAEEIRAITD